MYPNGLPSLFAPSHRYGQAQTAPQRNEHCCNPGPSPPNLVSQYYYPDSPTSSQQYQSKITSSVQPSVNRYLPYISHYNRAVDYGSPTQYA